MVNHEPVQGGVKLPLLLLLLFRDVELLCDVRYLLRVKLFLVIGVIHRLHTIREPLIYLSGYSSTIIVSAKYISRWALTLPGENTPITRVMPRRWLDLTGSRVRSVWEAGIRAVVGLIHLRPGISQVSYQ